MNTELVQIIVASVLGVIFAQKFVRELAIQFELNLSKAEDRMQGKYLALETLVRELEVKIATQNRDTKIFIMKADDEVRKNFGDTDLSV